jgi:hypothetical protein
VGSEGKSGEEGTGEACRGLKRFRPASGEEGSSWAGLHFGPSAQPKYFELIKFSAGYVDPVRHLLG